MENKAMDAASKIRAAYRSLASRPVGSWLPIMVEHNGVTQHFLVSQKRSSNGRQLETLHLAHVEMGRMLAGDKRQPIVNYYKLNGKNDLRPEGMPGYACEKLLSLWEEQCCRIQD